MNPGKYRSIQAFEEFEDRDRGMPEGEVVELSQAVARTLGEYGDLRRGELIQGFEVPPDFFDKAIFFLRTEKMIEIERGETADADLIRLTPRGKVFAVSG